MKIGRPKSALHLTSDEQAHLKSLVASRSIVHALGTRVRIILLSQEGLSNTAIASRLGLTRATVGKWRRRFVRDRIAGLHDELRSGRPRTHVDEQLAALITKTLRTQPAAQTHWSCRTMEAATGIATSTVHRIWQAFGLQPHRQRTFKLSPDPFFVEKVRDIVGLYLNPPDKALVLCVDEKNPSAGADSHATRPPAGAGLCRGRHP